MRDSCLAPDAPGGQTVGLSWGRSHNIYSHSSLASKMGRNANGERGRRYVGAARATRTTIQRILLMRLPHNEYKRIASNCAITACVQDLRSIADSEMLGLEIV
ncbi:hypothetical protein BKA82DRAFT_890766 [Pisolithus tinctorius]|uniref:Uncharacterized protein n=1 Tax=Pisolithus tinctorius Marx 270 TaxID=870435 RepID=A0A0C3N8Z4_PISTI|nr:hypothetical protein BKA82DRAFT_890766 [Pisolithus tinctorius]KIN97539.1 hypothetical protein M404DRAFT_890766 [Pisolithus tinctorius Marx 270]